MNGRKYYYWDKDVIRPEFMAKLRNWINKKWNNDYSDYDDIRFMVNTMLKNDKYTTRGGICPVMTLVKKVRKLLRDLPREFHKSRKRRLVADTIDAPAEPPAPLEPYEPLSHSAVYVTIICSCLA